MLHAAEKDQLLARVAQSDSLRVRSELLRRLQHDDSSAPSPPRRTVTALLDDAGRRRAELRELAAAQRRDEEARREAARSAARARRLDELAHEGDAAWSRVDAMIATRKPAEYDSAIALLTELSRLSERDGHFDRFTLRTMEIRREHARKPSFIQRLDRARL